MRKRTPRNTERDNKIIKLITVDRLNKSEVARRLRLSPERVRQLIKRLEIEGKLPSSDENMENNSRQTATA